jgi:hypothetical protein
VIPYPHELFLLGLIAVLLVLLSVGALLAGVYVGLFRRGERIEHDHTGPLPSDRLAPHTFGKKKGSSMTDKLGQKIVNYMIEISVSENRALIEDRIKKIQAECERLSSQPIPKENKEIISTVALWAKQFNIDRHLREMKMLKFSTQIVYDKANNDFKLMIAGK